MSHQFLHTYTCILTGKTHQLGVDSRITQPCEQPVSWKGYCICGQRVVLTKHHEKYTVIHKGPAPEHLGGPPESEAKILNLKQIKKGHLTLVYSRKDTE